MIKLISLHFNDKKHIFHQY